MNSIINFIKKNMKKYILVTLVLILIINLSVKAQSLNLSSVLLFSSTEEAKTLLNVEDQYTQNLTIFDINSRMHKQNATKEELIKFRNDEFQDWTGEEKSKIVSQVQRIEQQIIDSKYNLNIPKEIHFIKSSMKDEGEAEGYTRGNCIILKNGISELNDDALKDLILHELFHVLTRYDAQFRKDMYSIIGFTVCNEIPLIGKLKKYKISNPDAPFKDSYITFQKDGKLFDCMMILYSKEDYKEGTFFDYLNIGFVKLKGTTKKEIDAKNDEPQIFSIQDVAKELFLQIGMNTQYIIDPEESLADNFIFAINGKTDLKSPLIVEKIQSRLKK